MHLFVCIKYSKSWAWHFQACIECVWILVTPFPSLLSLSLSLSLCVATNVFKWALQWYFSEAQPEGAGSVVGSEDLDGQPPNVDARMPALPAQLLR